MSLANANGHVKKSATNAASSNGQKKATNLSKLPPVRQAFQFLQCIALASVIELRSAVRRV